MIEREHLATMATAVWYATGFEPGGIFDFMVTQGRLPHLGDPEPPWSIRGWLLPYAMDLLPAESGIGFGRWHYWFEVMERGALLDQPIPRVEFVEASTYTSAYKNAAKCVDLIAYELGSGGGAVARLIEWLAWALAVTKTEPRLPGPLQEKLYRLFDLGTWHEAPADYLGVLKCENRGTKTDRLGFYPTPHSLCALMAAVNFGAGEEQSLAARSAYDPAVGTGRTLLEASNYCLRLAGQDIDGSVVLATLINGAVYAPWLAFPFPEGVFGHESLPEVADQGEPLAMIDSTGQGLLFGLNHLEEATP